MTISTGKCDKPATAGVKLGSGPDVPACDEHIAAARALSAKAGKKPVPKGLSKAEAAAFTGANRDDVIPIHVRPLTAVERESEVACFNHLIPKGE
jgi:hypothetical protein